MKYQFIHAHAQAYGVTRSPRIHAELRGQGLRVSRKRIARQLAVATEPTVNRRWVADITYLLTQEGWGYLALVLDLASGRIVGWAMQVTLARWWWPPGWPCSIAHPHQGLHHSDRGSRMPAPTIKRC